jgi:predicted acetyltransferase
LATHPQYQGIGAGTALCNWGLKMSRLENVAVAVFASPMGRKLYRKLGFQKVTNVIIEAEGDDERINIAAMVYRKAFCSFYPYHQLSGVQSLDSSTPSANLMADDV